MNELSKKVINLLRKKKLKISFAESCTGGMLASSITAIRGSSKIFTLGLITYSNQSKINILKVRRNIIIKHGAVSYETCLSMVKNLSLMSKTHVSVSITGVAGPKGGTKVNPVGTVYIAVIVDNKKEVQKYSFKNRGRRFIRLASVFEALNLLGKKLDVQQSIFKG